MELKQVLWNSQISCSKLILGSFIILVHMIKPAICQTDLFEKQHQHETWRPFLDKMSLEKQLSLKK